jgi:cytochrome c2
MLVHERLCAGGRRGIVAVALAVVFLAAGCGGGGGGGGGDVKSELARGRQLFQLGPKGSDLSCSFCHTLRAADTKGPFGPSLDQEGREYQRQGWTDSRIRSFVRGFIDKGSCLDPHEPSRCMPKGLVSGDDEDAITTFVTTCAGKPATGACRTVPGSLRGEAAKGRTFYATLGCVGCHWTGAPTTPIGPSLQGLAGSKVELASGKTVTADDDYLLTSILDPDKDVVKGFPAGFMSARIAPGQVSVDQAKAIIVYLKTLK